jgi:hypothetical protein
MILQILLGGGSVWFGGKFFGRNPKAVYKYHRWVFLSFFLPPSILSPLFPPFPSTLSVHSPYPIFSSPPPSTVPLSHHPYLPPPPMPFNETHAPPQSIRLPTPHPLPHHPPSRRRMVLFRSQQHKRHRSILRLSRRTCYGGVWYWEEDQV